MIEVFTHNFEGFAAVFESGEWKMGLLGYSERFAKLAEMERHLLTDEAFVLLDGSATLHTDSESVEMEKHKVYNVPAGVWHHITLSPDGKVLVVENRNTSRNNTEKRYFDLKENQNADK